MLISIPPPNGGINSNESIPTSTLWCKIACKKLHYKAREENKDDTKDSKWIGDLFRLGLVKGSYIPCKPIRILREYSRYRYKLVSCRSSEKNRYQNALWLTATFFHTTFLLLTGQMDLQSLPCRRLPDERKYRWN